MNSGNRIGELVPLLEKFQFPYCDGKHEQVIRDEKGIPIPKSGGEKEFKAQYPLKDRFLRPACNHCEGHVRDPLLDMAWELQVDGKMTDELRAMTVQHTADLAAKITIDPALREARTGETSSVEQVPTIEEGEAAAAPFVLQHREIVDRMRVFTAALLAAAKSEAMV